MGLPETLLLSYAHLYLSSCSLFYSLPKKILATVSGEKLYESIQAEFTFQVTTGHSGKDRLEANFNSEKSSDCKVLAIVKSYKSSKAFMLILIYGGYFRFNYIFHIIGKSLYGREISENQVRFGQRIKYSKSIDFIKKNIVRKNQ